MKEIEGMFDLSKSFDLVERIKEIDTAFTQKIGHCWAASDAFLYIQFFSYSAFQAVCIKLCK